MRPQRLPIVKIPMIGSATHQGSCESVAVNKKSASCAAYMHACTVDSLSDGRDGDDSVSSRHGRRQLPQWHRPARFEAQLDRMMTKVVTVDGQNTQLGCRLAVACVLVTLGMQAAGVLGATVH